MVDSPPASRHHGNMIANSGVPFILRRWMKRRAISLTKFESIPWPIVTALRDDQQVGDWFTPPVGGVAQMMLIDPQAGGAYKMYARIGDGSSAGEVETDVRLSAVQQVTRVYLSPAFQYQVRTAAPVGGRVVVAFFSRGAA